jgi:hypothetical protein
MQRFANAGMLTLWTGTSQGLTGMKHARPTTANRTVQIAAGMPSGNKVAQAVIHHRQTALSQTNDSDQLQNDCKHHEPPPRPHHDDAAPWEWRGRIRP